MGPESADRQRALADGGWGLWFGGAGEDGAAVNAAARTDALELRRSAKTGVKERQVRMYGKEGDAREISLKSRFKSRWKRGAARRLALAAQPRTRPPGAVAGGGRLAGTDTGLARAERHHLSGVGRQGRPHARGRAASIDGPAQRGGKDSRRSLGGAR